MRRISYPLSNHLHVQSSFISHFYKKHLYKSCPPVSVIPNSISSINSFQAFSSTLSSFSVLLIGNKFSQKGYCLLLDLARECHQSKYSSITFHVYGSISSSNPSPPFPELSSTEFHPIPPNIHFHGSAPHHVIFSNTYSLFLHLASYEGFPNVVLEAISAGLPVYLRDSPGISSIFNPHTFHYIDSLEPSILAQDLFTLLSDQTALEEYAKTCSESISQYEDNNVFPLWNHLLNDL